MADETNIKPVEANKGSKVTKESLLQKLQDQEVKAVETELEAAIKEFWSARKVYKATSERVLALEAKAKEIKTQALPNMRDFETKLMGIVRLEKDFENTEHAQALYVLDYFGHEKNIKLRVPAILQEDTFRITKQNIPMILEEIEKAIRADTPKVTNKDEPIAAVKTPLMLVA